MDKINNKQHQEEKHCKETKDTAFSEISESVDTTLPDEKNSKESSLTALADQISKKLDQLEFQISQINQRMESFERMYKDKLKNDDYADRINDRLHKELQDYKNDLLVKMTQPVINDIISFYDDLEKILFHHSLNPDEFSPEKCISVLKDLKNYVLDILEKHDVHSFQNDSNKYDPKTQKVLKIVQTDDQDQMKKVSKHIRPGFKRHEKIIRSEGVEVYTYTPAEDTVLKPETDSK